MISRAATIQLTDSLHEGTQGMQIIDRFQIFSLFKYRYELLDIVLHYQLDVVLGLVRTHLG